MSASPTPSAVPDDLREMATTVARQAGCVLHVGAVEMIAAALLQVRNAEREACAERALSLFNAQQSPRLYGAGMTIAAAIRARA